MTRSDRYRDSNTWARALASLFVALAMLGAPPASARGDGDMWSIGVTSMCWAQDTGYREWPFGKRWAQSYWFQGWEEFDRRPETRCFRDSKWSSDALCSDLMRIDDEDPTSLESIYRKHRKEIQGMESAFNYMNEQRGAKGVPIPCPEKPIEVPPAPKRGPACITVLICFRRVSGTVTALRRAKRVSSL